MAEPPLRILIVGLTWPPETFITRLIRGLLAQGVQITVATADKPAAEWLQRPGFDWIYSPAWTGTPWHRIGDTLRFGLKSLFVAPAQLAHCAQKPYLQSWHRFLPFAGHHWDLVYFPWNSAAITYFPLWQDGAPAVISCRGSQVNIAPHDPQRAEFTQGLRLTLARAARVHCVSADICAEAEKYGLERTKACIIRPAVDPERFHPGSDVIRDETTLRLITTGSLIWRKGYEYLLLTVQQLHQDGLPVHLKIIGSGPEEQRLLYTIDDLGLNESVQLLGQLTPTQVIAHLQQADIFLLASLSEGLSNAVLEAMACGLPVVTTDCGGMREAVCDGREGFVVPIADPGAMARAVKQLWEKPELRKQMGITGRSRIESEFNLTSQIERFQELFLEAVRNP